MWINCNYFSVQLSKEDFAIFGGVYGNKGDGAFQNLEASFFFFFKSFLV